MKFYLTLNAARIATGLIACTILSLPLTATAAPKRTYVCPTGDLVVTVLSQQTIRVAVKMPETDDGNFTMTMQRQGKGYRYVSGEYVVKITQEQNELTYSAPDFGNAKCNWEGY